MGFEIFSNAVWKRWDGTRSEPLSGESADYPVTATTGARVAGG